MRRLRIFIRPKLSKAFRFRSFVRAEGGVFYTARPSDVDGLDTARDYRTAFMTARSRGTESELELETTRELETARDTARGSDTDYTSTFEPATARSMEDIEVI